MLVPQTSHNAIEGSAKTRPQLVPESAVRQISPSIPSTTTRVRVAAHTSMGRALPTATGCHDEASEYCLVRYDVRVAGGQIEIDPRPLPRQHEQGSEPSACRASAPLSV